MSDQVTVKVIPDPSPPPQYVILTIPWDYAVTLRTVGNYVGGDSDTTRRGHISSINAALDLVGVKVKDNCVEKSCSGIYFVADQ